MANVVLLHYTMLTVIYVPFFFILNQGNLKLRDPQSTENTRAEAAFIVYWLSIIPYLAIITIYYRVARRWNENKRKIEPNPMLDLDQAIDESPNQTVLGGGESPTSSTHDANRAVNVRKKIFIDPMRLEASYMAQSRPLIQNALSNISNKQEEENE